jgi:WXXGXW repeat (2 copies)
LIRALGFSACLAIALAMPMQEAAAQDPVGGAIVGGATGAIIGGVLGGGRGAAIGAIIGGATGAAIGAEGEPRPGGYRYYQDACYQQRPDGAWLAVSPEYCALAPAYAQDSIGISVDIAPPPLPIYDQPPIPAPGYIWTPGYWAWDDDTGYYWVPGTWVLPPEPRLLWTPGYWGWNDGVYAFHEGYWGPEVGFYGGVSYGFGYTGQGYEGGYWRGGTFFYNRTVNNISNVQISNVYNKAVVVNNATNVSYNRGAGGTTAQETQQQIAAANQQHVPPTPQQTQHMQMAAKDPALSLNNNKGHPTVAATTHAAQLNGAGIVAAHPGTPLAAIKPQGHHVGGARGATTGNVPAGQGAKTGPGNAATIQGSHALPGVQSPAITGGKVAPGANTATLPGNHTLPGVQSPGAAGTGAAGRKTGTGNAATLPGNHALPGVQQHGGTTTGTSAGSPPPDTASTPPVNKLPTTAVHSPPPHAAVTSPPPPPRAAAPPPPRVAAPPPRAAVPSPPHVAATPPPPPPHAVAPPSPRVAAPPPRAAVPSPPHVAATPPPPPPHAAAPPPRPPGPTAKPKCQPGQQC